MNPRTVATLDELLNAQWFKNVGIQDTRTAIVLTSWDEAIAHCSSLEWENLCQDAINNYCARLFETHKERFNQWNAILSEVRPYAMDVVSKKTSEIVVQHGLPEMFISTVRWDIMHICMEAEYADVVQPGFYASQAYWYVKGHFPCGYSGVFPNGKRIIY